MINDPIIELNENAMFLRKLLLLMLTMESNEIDFGTDTFKS